MALTLLTSGQLGWLSYLSKGVEPTTNRALYPASACAGHDAPLRFLASRLHLVSFATASDVTMMRHFLRHYTALGVPPAHMLVHVFARGGGGGGGGGGGSATRAGSGGDAVLRLLHEAGATRSVLLDVPYNDSYKLQLINAHQHGHQSGCRVGEPQRASSGSSDCIRRLGVMHSGEGAQHTQVPPRGRAWP